MTHPNLADFELALRSWRRYIADQVMGEAELQALDIALLLMWASNQTSPAILEQLAGYLRDPKSIQDLRDADFIAKIKAAAQR